jgi:hypothetical protein
MVSVLFVAKNSVYKTLGVDCWDEERDAMLWPGGNPVVAHPPCRLFSQLKHMSTAPESEKHLAYRAVACVRKYGGVLEHPAMSTLWKEAALPKPGSSDEYGICIAVNQWWWGHPARKSTWLYICGCEQIPEIPLRIGEAEFIAGGRTATKKEIHHNWGRGDRSATPPAFARWLIETAERCKTSQPL